MKKIIAATVSIGLLSACSAFVPHKERISIMTDQPDATIFVNGTQVGKGNVQTKVKRNKNVQIMAKKAGYQTAFYTIDSSLSVTGILDIIGVFVWVIPIVGVFTPGAKSLDETNVALNLDPMCPVQP